ncbi:MAG: hypothetical protein KDD67_05605 [Ignavibacteriae bacterium]|nr:hypothetical protein [Ignavibacteriota bacterium]MCB9214248.1 hypothetical protein [Ignavibacteria bacterium]
MAQNIHSLLLLVSSLLLCSTVAVVGQHSVDDNGLLFFPPKLTGSFADQTGAGGIGQSVLRLNVGQLEIHRTLPFFPVVFFDGPGSTTIPLRYRLPSVNSSLSQARASEIIHLNPDESVIEVYREILNVIGYRMRNSDEHLYLTGCYTTDLEEGEQTGWERAKSIRAYLTTVWNVPADQITLREPRLLGELTDPEEMRREGRAVWMEFEHGTIVSPFIYAVTLNPSFSIPIELQLRPNMKGEEIASFEIHAWLDGRLVSTDRILKRRDDSIYTFQGAWDISPSSCKAFPSQFEVRVDVISLSGERRTSELLLVQLAADKNRLIERASHHYYALWDIMPRSIYHMRDTELQLTDMLDASLQMSSRGRLHLYVGVPKQTEGNSDQDGGEGLMDHAFACGGSEEVNSVIGEIVGNSASVDTDKVSQDDDSFLCGPIVWETGSTTVSTDELMITAEKYQPREAIEELLRQDQESRPVIVAKVEKDDLSMKSGMGIVRHVLKYLQKMREKEVYGMINSRSLATVAINAIAPLNFFVPSTPEEECYNRSIQVVIH